MLEVVAERIERAEELSIEKGELLLKDLLLHRRRELFKKTIPEESQAVFRRKFIVKLNSEFSFMVELLYAVSVTFFVSIIDYKLLNLLILTPVISTHS